MNINESGPDACILNMHVTYDPCSPWGGDLIFKYYNQALYIKRSFQDMKALKAVVTAGGVQLVSTWWSCKCFSIVYLEASAYLAAREKEKPCGS